jgi:hypothetical protein
MALTFYAEIERDNEKTGILMSKKLCKHLLLQSDTCQCWINVYRAGGMAEKNKNVKCKLMSQEREKKNIKYRERVRERFTLIKFLTIKRDSEID